MKTINLEIVPLHTKIYREYTPDNKKVFKLTAMNNESVSFTAAYKSADETIDFFQTSIRAECENAELSAYSVGYVPVLRERSSYEEYHRDYSKDSLYPDILVKRPSAPTIVETEDQKLPFYESDSKAVLTTSCDCASSVVFTFNEEGKPLNAGKYDIKVQAVDLRTNTVSEESLVTFDVLNGSLPETDLIYTNWFHNDSLADIYGIELYSDEYFEIFERFVRNAVLHGMTTLLTPAFTPSFDTIIGEERMKVQLVRIYREGQEYRFDFSLLEKYIDIALKCGIKYIEHSPLFTQWGAKYAPNIYAFENGVEKQIFGWETNACGTEYITFLRQYLTKLTEFFEKKGLLSRVVMHISDEPVEKNLSDYMKAYSGIEDLLKPYLCGDALSEILFYENGCVKLPIASVHMADDFYGKCDKLMLYYTCGQYCGLNKCSNRRLIDTGRRTRILGLHLFYYKAIGFLHWGYNYYYDTMSKGVINPCLTSYKMGQGLSYIVYPGLDRKPLTSIREKLMNEAMQDYKALKLLEQFIGYDAVVKLCEEFFGCEINSRLIPESDEQMLSFRETVNEEIAKYII